MDIQYLRKLKLPDKPGIYIFRDYRRRPTYIGRATSLRDRTKSYFSNDLIETRGPRIVDMVTKARFVTFQETDSVLEAILLESLLIKQYQPFYNVDEKDDRSHQYVVITEEPWPRVFLARARDLEQGIRDKTLTYQIRRSFGPFLEAGLIIVALRILRRLFPFRDKKAIDPRHEEFYKTIGMSPATDSEQARQEYERTINYLILFFEGKKSILRKEIDTNMNKAAQDLRFEDADRSKRLLYALDHINDIALIKKNKSLIEKGFRIEAYDIAHLSGTNVVGAMTVSLDGVPAPDQYRKFKISREANNDTAGLAEMLLRRLNHSEWTYPNLVVVDGNEIQINVAKNILAGRRIDIPVVAVTKDAAHKAANIVGSPAIIKKYKNEIISVNAEAHRFAIKYHRLRRTKGFGLKS